MFELTLVNVASALLFLTTCKVLHQFVKYRYFHQLSSFPGPVLATTTRLWLAFHVVKGADYAYHAFKHLHEEYGPVIRISPTTILVSDARAVPLIYGRNVAKTPAYGAGIPLEVRQSMMNMQDPKTHAYHRKLVAAPFSTGNIRKMEPVIDQRIDHWLSTMEERFSKPGLPVDLAQWVTFLTHDVISNLAFGQPLGFVQNGADVQGLVRDIRGSLVFIGVMSRMYPVFNWLRDIGVMGAICPDMERTPLGTLARFRDRLTDERMAAKAAGQESEKNDLFQALLEAKDEKGDPIDEEYIKAEILNLILAGAETTGSSLQSFLFRLLSDHEVRSKVMTEIEAAENAGHFKDKVIRFDDLNAHCPYYVACWKESLRLVPPVPSEFPRVVPAGGITLHGHFIPEGTDIAISTWVGQRDKSVYGEDADEFKPERWYKQEDAAEFSRLGLAWGSGARKCLGQDIARMEIHKAALEFLRRFKGKIVDGTEGRKKAELVFTGDMSHYEDMWVSLERR